MLYSVAKERVFCCAATGLIIFNGRYRGSPFQPADSRLCGWAATTLFDRHRRESRWRSCEEGMARLYDWVYDSFRAARTRNVIVRFWINGESEGRSKKIFQSWVFLDSMVCQPCEMTHRLEGLDLGTRDRLEWLQLCKPWGKAKFMSWSSWILQMNQPQLGFITQDIFNLTSMAAIDQATPSYFWYSCRGCILWERTSLLLLLLASSSIISSPGNLQIEKSPFE